jgi:leucyl/phenylalanyl-tRNA--protein transferase
MLILRPGQPFPADIALRRGSADYPDLIAAGGDLRPERLLAAYRHGLFPWYSEGQPILWWSPDPRMVLKTAQFRLHRSLRQAIKRLLAAPAFELAVDRDFAAVVRACAGPRAGQSGTWINADIVAAYGALHAMGHAHSFEVWLDGELRGGLYGVSVGRMFFGESMFSMLRDASKTALFALVCACRARGIEWIDCQQETAHLASLGARPVSHEDFVRHLQMACAAPPPTDWAYDRSQLSKDLAAYVAT